MLAIEPRTAGEKMGKKEGGGSGRNVVNTSFCKKCRVVITVCVLGNTQRQEWNAVCSQLHLQADADNGEQNKSPLL